MAAALGCQSSVQAPRRQHCPYSRVQLHRITVDIVAAAQALCLQTSMTLQTITAIHDYHDRRSEWQRVESHEEVTIAMCPNWTRLFERSDCSYMPDDSRDTSLCLVAEAAATALMQFSMPRHAHECE